jgi:hypothetical protein
MVLASSAVLVTGCLFDGTDSSPDRPVPVLAKQARVQVAYDASSVAFRFTWRSQKKTIPAGQASAGQNYPGHFHDMLQHNGTRFDRLAANARMDEDRITFMIDRVGGGIPEFAAAGCASTCHSTTMESHTVPVADATLDHWHWRGGRTGPMGYAEDAAVNATGRIRDAQGTPPSRFLRSAGDRIREDQAAMTGTAHPVLVNGLPRFVFNKDKALPDNFTVPAFFLAGSSGAILTDPHTEIPAVKDLSVNRSLLVVFQDPAFDPVDKANALDLGYLVMVATGQSGHLPSHLRVADAPETVFWRNYAGAQSGIGPTAVAQAEAKLDEVLAEWLASNQEATVTRSVGFIYASDQHDVTSDRHFDAATSTWTVTMYRRLSTNSANDADLTGLPSGAAFTVNFAMHDVGGGSETHNISMPITVSNSASSDLRAASTSDVRTADWTRVPAFDTNWVNQVYQPKWNWAYLKLGGHGGAGSVGTRSCISCHGDALNNEIVRQ